MSRLALYLLGPPRLEVDGKPAHISRRKAVALLAYLAVTKQSHSRDSLATLLWPEYDQSRARTDLRRTLSVLNRTLGEEWIIADRETAGLNPDAGLWVDVDQFRQWLATCETHAHPATELCPDCLSLLTEAVELYHDDFMAGFALRDSAEYDEWQFFCTEELKDQLASVLERLVRYHSAQGEYEPAIAYARRWLTLDSLHEPVHRHLMHLYAQAGQRATALRQYQECARILEAELGLLPSEETTSLYEHIRTTPAGREEPLFPVSLPRHNLPAQSTPFVGRKDELADIKTQLSEPDCRLLTLVGPGGSGKTRLALQAAADILSDPQLDTYAHGVFFVSLAPLQSADAIVPTVAQALDFTFYEGAEPQQQLLDYLRQKTMLLILDNCEHLLARPESLDPSTLLRPGSARDKLRRREDVGLVIELLKTAPEVKVLATSRTRLNVEGEHRFHIGGMNFPELTPLASADASQYSAVELFLQSARRTQPSFELTDENLSGVVQICRLVAGMPLGIQLAAAWVAILTPAEIAVEIGRSLDFLETDRRDVPQRQRSIRAAVDYSWNLLTARERTVMQALSVFRGGSTREAAQAVTGASLRELMSLVGKSQLHRTPTGRYEVHGLLRQYAAEKLSQTPTAGEAARDRHSAYYAAALQQWVEDLKGPRQRTALAEMDVEIENARAAWDWAVEQGQVARLDQGMEGLCRFYDRRGRWQEGEATCRTTASRLAPADSLAAVEGVRVRARALVWQSCFNQQPFGRTELAHQLVRQSLELLEGLESADQEPVLPVPSQALSADETAIVEGAVEESSPKDTRPEKAFALWQMGRMMIYSDYKEARRLWEQSLALYRALGDRWGTAKMLRLLGDVAEHFGTYSEARQLFEESLAIQQAQGDQREIAWSLRGLGIISWAQGQFEEAERLFRKSFDILQKTGDRADIAHGLGGLGEVLVRLGKFAEGHSLMKKSLVIYNDRGNRHDLTWINLYLGEAQTHLGRYEQARTRGQMALILSREIAHRWSIGFSHFVLGLVALAMETYDEAQRLLQESVAVFREIETPGNLGWALAVLGYAARGLGQLSQAGRHLSKVLQAFTEVGNFSPLMYALPGIALLLADRGDKERAVELYALASRYPLVANSRWFEDVAGQHIAAMAATLPPEIVAAAQEHGRARDLKATVAELLAELGE
jgi:predicted ATPase/DNA-binding SARP family transcriptional activator